MATVSEIDQLLPQTQCGECEFAGCRPYAEALAQGRANIDRCPPGGISTLQALGRLLKIDATPFLAKVDKNTRKPSVARIRESECIGCTKCIQACPVDAIIGSGKLMHAIIELECTGCGLCVEPCPVDCIDMVTLPAPVYKQETARKRFEAREVRLLREAEEKERTYRQKKRLAAHTQQQQDKNAKKDYILEALARVKARKAAS